MSFDYKKVKEKFGKEYADELKYKYESTEEEKREISALREYGEWKSWVVISFWCLISLCILVVIILPPIFVNSVGASQGEHTGIVTAVEKNDNILWDANLVYFKTSEESTQEDVYCVNDLELYNLLEEKAKTRELITIKFSNKFWFMRQDCNGGISIITGMKGDEIR